MTYCNSGCHSVVWYRSNFVYSCENLVKWPVARCCLFAMLDCRLVLYHFFSTGVRKCWPTEDFYGWPMYPSIHLPPVSDIYRYMHGAICLVGCIPPSGLSRPLQNYYSVIIIITKIPRDVLSLTVVTYQWLLNSGYKSGYLSFLSSKNNS